ncbi:MAG TPA: DUF1343 domain-containing protein, partial [Anaerolineae bacterium]|nr:DUF1343 domain-containing protein [Anaerolineae bacterium]
CRPVKFRPTASKFSQQLCVGIEVEVVDRPKNRPIIFTLTLIAQLIRQHPDHFQWHAAHFDRLIGNHIVRQQLHTDTPITQITSDWQAQCATFAAQCQPILLYA